MLFFRVWRIVTAVKHPLFRIQTVSISSPRGGQVIPTALLLFPSLLLQKFLGMTHTLCLSYSFLCFFQNPRSLSFTASPSVSILLKVFDTFCASFHARITALNCSLLSFLKWGKQAKNITILCIFVCGCVFVYVSALFQLIKTLADFHENWHENLSIWGHSGAVYFHFQQPFITAVLTCEQMSSSGAGVCELDPEIIMVMYLGKSCDSYECDIGV